MSQESIEDLNTLNLVSQQIIEGAQSNFFRTRDGEQFAWHYSPEAQGDESNHYPGFVPVEDVRRRLFNWTPVERPVQMLLDEDEFQAKSDELIHVADVPNGLGWQYLVEDPTRKVITRSDTNHIMGAFKDGYVPHEYQEWLLENVAKVLSASEGDLGIVAAGLLRKGAVAYVQITPQEGVTIGGDKMIPTLIAATSFDGSLATHYTCSVHRICCENSLSVAIHTKGASKISYKHTRHSGLKVAEAREALGMFFESTEEWAESVEQAMNTEVSSAQLWKIFDELNPLADDATPRAKSMRDKRWEGIRGLWIDDPRVAPYAGTAWGVEQAFNTFRQHEGTFRRSTDVGSRTERNRLSSVTGVTDRLDAEVAEATRKVLAAV